jgi:tetratricopeptide (TPR) repeat protein
MKGTKRKILATALLVAVMMVGKAAYAQTPPQGTPPATNPPAGAQTPGQAPAQPLTLDNAAPPVNAEEDAAIKAYRETPVKEQADVTKKLQLGEDFLTKYPQSRYRAEVLGWQVKGYLGTGQMEKMETAGEKELALEPNDAQTMAILGSALPRSISNTMTAEQKTKVLDDAEKYSKKALELVPTIPKPPSITDEQFIAAKNQVQAMAYSGLGLVAFRRNKFAEAIPNLEQAIKYDPNPDPVNYLVLGICNEKASHFDDAVTAFTKCAAIQSSLAATCKSGIEEAKKLAATQLSVPK